LAAITALLSFVTLSVGVACADPSPTVGPDHLLTPSDREFLLEELARIDPPRRIRELAKYGARQLELGGGFYGMLPEQLSDPDAIPLPVDDAGRMEAAVYLAQQRRTNIEAMTELDADYPLSFAGASLPEFLRSVDGNVESSGAPDRGLRLRLDTSALDGFFAALADGRITADEATKLAELPANRAMLEHRRNLGYVPEPLPDTGSLAEMIRMAGSPDPLDRLWCWINPQNDFGYADLARRTAGYERFLSELDTHRGELAGAVLAQIARYTPADATLDARFAFTVGWAIRGWATPAMAGLNVEQVKDDWKLLFGTLVEETFHRLQLRLCPTATGGPAQRFSDIATADTGDERYDRLYEIVAYTVLEGSANVVRGRFAAVDLAAKAPAGSDLMTRFVDRVVTQGELDDADALISEGLRGNGPLYGLGWVLASGIARHEGTRAVGEHLRRGPVHFFVHAASLAEKDGGAVVSSVVLDSVERLEALLTQ
jgi:hypothetical protein